ncbi:MAG: spore coat protein [Pseudobdellovibrionaceae bacterium]
MIGAVIQARVSSSRLPGKVLRTILQKPMLEWQIERLKKTKSIDKICLATSTQPEDSPLEEIANRQGLEFFRGSLEDVLDRFYQAAKSLRCETIVRITGDCPLIDPKITDQVIQYFVRGGYDYASNTLNPSFPDGLDVEVVSFSALQKVWNEAKLTSEREHVTPYFYKHPELFKLGSMIGENDYSDLRWTVDDEADFKFVSSVYETFKDKAFGMNDILELLEMYPELSAVNAGKMRNEGYTKSLTKDQTKK